MNAVPEILEKPKKEATSIKIDPVLWKEAKIEAIKHDMELGELVEQSLRKEIKTLRKLGEVKV
jgi:hypothetical protein